jgi:hypothetical protein
MKDQRVEEQKDQEQARKTLRIEVTDFDQPYEDLDDSVVFTRSTSTSCSTS